MILVTGATGNVGRQVVAQLAAAGEPVRTLSRHPERVKWRAGVEAVAGDLTQDLPTGVFDGVRGPHLFPVPDRVADTVRSAASAGGQHVTVLSSLAVGMVPDSPLQRRHLVVEGAVESSGMAWTHLRPGMFMTNTWSWAAGIRTSGVVRQPYPDATAAPIHEADIAGVAVAALLDPVRHSGAAYELSGPAPLSQLDRVAVIAHVLGREVRFEEQSRDEARADLLANPWMTGSLADSLLDLLAASSGVREPLVLPTVQDVLGREPLTFSRWVADHREQFTARPNQTGPADGGSGP